MQTNLSMPTPATLAAWPQSRPRIVFARDDAPGAERKPSETSPIVIVEDDYLVASQMEAALGNAGFVVAGVATSAEEALDLAAAERPALVVMDIRLNGPRDGIDAALELFRTHGIRCVFATAHQDENARRRASPAAPLGWLPKPYTMASLVEIVRRALRDLSDECQ